MPTRLCLAPRCPNPAVRIGRCQRHAKQRNTETRSANKGVYNSKRWRLLRRRKLFDTPLCEWPGCEAIAVDVHHKQAIQAGGLPYHMGNLEALCHPHHSVKTRQEQAG